MKERRQRFDPIIQVVLGVAVMAMLTLSACTGADGQVSLSSARASDFTLQLVKGGEISLADELKDGKVVLVFFASWCPSCVREVPQVNTFYAKNKGKISVIGINIQESAVKVQAFIDRKGVTYPVVLDSDGAVAGQYGVTGIPTIVAVDTDGTVLYRGHSMLEMEKTVTF